MTLYLKEGVQGILIKKSNTTGKFGETDLRDSVTWNFDPQHPVVGIYGYTGFDSINGMGFITYDTENDCPSTTTPSSEEEGTDGDN